MVFGCILSKIQFCSMPLAGIMQILLGSFFTFVEIHSKPQEGGFTTCRSYQPCISTGGLQRALPALQVRRYLSFAPFGFWYLSN